MDVWLRTYCIFFFILFMCWLATCYIIEKYSGDNALIETIVTLKTIEQEDHEKCEYATLNKNRHHGPYTETL